MAQRDTMRSFRKSIFQCLNGNVMYNGVVIPGYDEKVFTGQNPDLYYLFGTQRETDITDNDCTWTTKSTIDIVIVSRTQSEASKDAVDDISDTILDLLLNLPGSDNLIAQSGFQITYLKRESAVSGLIQISPTETILQKLITLTANIIQQN